jgi:hypothetical protein
MIGGEEWTAALGAARVTVHVARLTAHTREQHRGTVTKVEKNWI